MAAMPPADAPRPDSISASSPPTPAPPASAAGDEYAPSALPSTFARALAFASILLGGLCGGLIGWSLVDLTCESGDCGVAAGLAGLAGAVIGAGGVAVVAVLALRAMGEWRTIQHRQAQAQPQPPADADRR
jgi:predicted lipid-binding transport protein (Tim44 family)